MLQRLFDRPFKSNFDPQGALESMLYSRDVQLRAIAQNLTAETAVTPQRADQFLPYVGFVGSRAGRITIDVICDALVLYNRERVRAFRPDYADPHLNQQNILGTNALPRDMLLGRIVDITSLRPVMQWGSLRDHPRLSGFPASPESGLRWLDEHLIGPPAQVQSFVHAVLQVHNEYGHQTPLGPSWVVPWQQLVPHLDSGPERLLEAAGTTKPDAPRWLLILQYQMREAGMLIRPSQLDAGFYAFFFPTPPGVAPESGNPVMDLGVESRHAPAFTSQFIHEPINLTIDHWYSGGALCLRTVRPVSADLAIQRQLHLTRLKSVYGDAVAAWMGPGV